MQPLLHSVAGIITSGLNSSTAATPVRISRPYRAEHRLRVSGADAGLEAAALLAQRFPFQPPAYWERRVSGGLVTVNGRSPAGPCRPGDLLVHIREEAVEPAVPDLCTCLVDRTDWSVWFKPAPLPMHAGGRYLHHTFTGLAGEQIGRPVLPVHRLDAVTSGLVLAAHTPPAAARLSATMQGGEVTKVYIAVVDGVPKHTEWTVEAPVRRKKGFVFECHPDGAPARTRFAVIESCGDRSVVACRPETGRTHQIRLHLRYSGHPVWDDPVYGPGIADPDGSRLQNAAISLVNAALFLPGEDLRLELPGFTGLL